jgi:hypothetical protein
MHHIKLLTLFLYLSVGIILLNGLKAQDQDGFEEEFNNISERSFDNGDEETNNYDLIDDREKINMKRNSDTTPENLAESESDEDCEIPAESSTPHATTKKVGFFSNILNGIKKNKDDKKQDANKKKKSDKKTAKKPKTKTTTADPIE